jgi:hypothetical protein
LPDDAEVNRLAASTVEHFDAYRDMVPAGVRADNPDFLHIAAARTLVCDILNGIGEDRFAPGADLLKEKYDALSALDYSICALYGKIQP